MAIQMSLKIYYSKYSAYLMTQDNVVDWSMTWTLGNGDYYVPGCVCVPKITITGFVENPVKIGSYSLTPQNVFDEVTGYTIVLYDETNGVARARFIGNRYESITYRDDGAMTLTFYNCLYKHGGDVTLNKPFYSLKGTTSDAITLFGKIQTAAGGYVDTSCINDTDMSGAIGDYYAPINVPIYVASTQGNYEYLDALSLICGYTGTFAVFDTVTSGTSISTNAVIKYPKISEYSLSDSVGDVSGKIYPMYDGSVEPSSLPCRYPRYMYLYYWQYSSQWLNSTRTISTYSSQFVDEKKISFKMNDNVYIYSGTSGALDRFSYNLTSLIFGEITNNKTVPASTKSNHDQSECYYYGTFKTVQTFDFKIGDIVNVTVRGTTVPIIIQELSINKNGTEIRSYGAKEGTYEFSVETEGLD